MKKKNSRGVAADIVSKWIAERRFPDRELARIHDDHAFVMEVVNGVVRNRAILEWLCMGMLEKKPEPYFLALIYVGLYQLLFMDVEEYAVINETVDAAKGRPGGAGHAGLINAVLRRAQREHEQIFRELKRQPLHVRLSHPEFLVKRWMRQHGEIDTRKLLEWNNQPPDTVVRVVKSVVDPEVFVREAAEAGIELLPHPFRCRETFYTVPRGVAVTQLPGFDEGWFMVQDPATTLSVDLLMPLPGQSVLDACAAPGGKTALIAERMRGEGEFVAMDLHADRIETLRENMKRMQLDWVELVKGDARDPAAALAGRKFDAILLDVPCLNTGVLRRRIDARWRINSKRFEMINETQEAILTACSKLLKPGGRLVYSTCSIEPEENEELVTRWVRVHPECRNTRSKKAFPPKTQTDGAFAARIEC